MAVIAGDGDERVVMIAPTAGGPPRAIYRTSDDDQLMGTAWTRGGGRVLAFRRLPKGGGGEVWSIPTNGGSPEKSPLRIQPSEGAAVSPEGPAVSPDGTQVAFVGGSRKSEIWVMTGLFQDTKAAVR